MSQATAYQNFLTDTINDFITHKRLSVEQIFIQVVDSIMQAEREVFLSETSHNKANGYYERFLNSFQGKLLLHIPRDRQGHFHPFLLEVLKQDNKRMQDLALSLYSHGVSHRGVHEIFQSIFGTQLSPTRLPQLIKAFEPNRVAWQSRSLEKNYHVVIIDAIHQAVRRGTVEQEAIYVMMGLKKDFTREVLGLYQLPHESAAGWEEVFIDLKARGIENVGLVLCDELSGIENAIEAQLPHHHIQSCLVHKIRRILLRARQGHKAQIAEDWRYVLGLEHPNHSQEQFVERIVVFINKWKRYCLRFRKWRSKLCNLTLRQ